MEGVEDMTVEEKRDDARPFFFRNAGEIGIYIDAVDAVPKNATDYGSEHYFMMSLMEKLYELLIVQDLVDIKGRIESHSVMQGVILERFKKGIVLGVTFDDVNSLSSLVDLHKSGHLCTTFQEVFVNKAVLAACGACKIRLRTKIWSDEIAPCMEEIQSRSAEIVPLSDMDRDLHLLKGVREYQRKLVGEIMSMRDGENRIEQSLGQMIHAIKQVIPARVTSIPTLRDFLKYAKTASAKPGTDREVIKTYVDMLEKGKRLFAEVEKRICHALAQVHGVCEKDQQKQLKIEIKNTCKRMRELTKKDVDIRRIVNPEWKGKILQRENDIFMGAVSLIPSVVNGIFEIDHKTDEYISDFPDEI